MPGRRRLNALVSTEAHAAYTQLADDLEVSVTNVLDVIGWRIAAGKPIDVTASDFIAEVKAEHEAKVHAPRPRTPKRRDL